MSSRRISWIWRGSLASPVLIRLAEDDDLAAVRSLCRAYRDVLIARSRDVPSFVETYYGDAKFDALLQDLPRLHAPPDGAIYVAGDPIIGCAMIHRIDAQTCEIKRVYVDPAARGTGAGIALFHFAMTDAHARGYRRMVLDTFHTLTEAMALYDKLGFAQAAPFYAPDPKLEPLLRFYEKAL